MCSSGPVVRYTLPTLLPAMTLSGCLSDGDSTAAETETDSIPGTVSSVFDENGVDQTFADEFRAALAQDYEPFVAEPAPGQAQAPGGFIVEGRLERDNRMARDCYRRCKHARRSYSDVVVYQCLKAMFESVC